MPIISHLDHIALQYSGEDNQRGNHTLPLEKRLELTKVYMINHGNSMVNHEFNTIHTDIGYHG